MIVVFLLLSYSLFFPRMIQSLRSEALKSEDMFMHLQEIQESVRLAFLNCFLHFSGIMMSHYISFTSGWLIKIFLATLNYVVILCALIRSPGAYWRWACSNQIKQRKFAAEWVFSWTNRENIWASSRKCCWSTSTAIDSFEQYWILQRWTLYWVVQQVQTYLAAI